MDGFGTVLIVAADLREWDPIAEQLRTTHNYRVYVVRNAAEMQALLPDLHVDFVLANEGEGGSDGLALLTRLRTSHPEIIRVLALESRSDSATKAITQAAIFQFLRHPLDPEQVCLVVKRGLETREIARRHRILSREFKVSGEPSLFLDRHAGPFPAERQRFEKLVYVSEAMADLCDLAKLAAKTELPILIQGDTGTGKELLARAIHHNSNRKASPLLVQNCGGMPSELLHSELFGHKRGAFTGAISDRLGLFRAADGGTVFLDEISDVSPAFQVSLLRFLQDGEVKPVGSDQISICNVRIIAASNRPLRDLVEKGEFRRDLYFRLKGFELEVPALRDRPDDIPALAEFFAAKHCEMTNRKILGISASLLDKLVNYGFPGNVRELENEVRRLVAIAKDGEYLTTRHLSPTLLAARAAPKRNQNGAAAIEGDTLKDRVENLEKYVLAECLQKHRWNQSRAADELGLSRVGLANKIKRYGLAEISP
jgi:two-component system, NtrC family, response regulator HupR/HoxA